MIFFNFIFRFFLFFFSINIFILSFGRIVSKNNQNKLMSILDDIFASVVASISRAPRQLREMCAMLKENITDVYGNDNTNQSNVSNDKCIRVGVGGFIFLRFLCPAIISPVEAGLLDANDAIPTPTARRALLMVSKIIQKLANGTRFRQQLEPHLMGLNGWLEFHDASMLEMCKYSKRRSEHRVMEHCS